MIWKWRGFVVAYFYVPSHHSPARAEEIYQIFWRQPVSGWDSNQEPPERERGVSLLNRDIPQERIKLILIKLQAGRSRVRFLMWSLDFSIDLILPAALALGSIQSLIEMSTKNLPGSKGRPASTADKLTANCEPIL
jgi:hypothetical protein